MRTFNGREITSQYLEGLTATWHNTPNGNVYTLEEWIRNHTGFSHDEFVSWIANGRIPNE